MDFDPERLLWVNDRLSTIYSLEKKHQVSEISELLTIAEDLRQRLSAIDNADERIALPPALLQRAFAQFYNFCKGYLLKDKTLPPALTERIIALAKEVRQAGSEALIVTGIDLMHVPLLAFELNEQLQSAAFGLRTPRLTRQGKSAVLRNLISDMQEGKVGVLFINNLNPLYSLAKADGFAEGLAKVPFSV